MDTSHPLEAYRVRKYCNVKKPNSISPLFKRLQRKCKENSQETKFTDTRCLSEVRRLRMVNARLFESRADSMSQVSYNIVVRPMNNLIIRAVRYLLKFCFISNFYVDLLLQKSFKSVSNRLC